VQKTQYERTRRNSACSSADAARATDAHFNCSATTFNWAKARSRYRRDAKATNAAISDGTFERSSTGPGTKAGARALQAFKGVEAPGLVNMGETPAIAVEPGCLETAREPGSTEATVRLKTILVPTDFSDESGKALRHAMALANALGAQIVLLHVFKAVTYPGWSNLVLPKDLDQVIIRSQRQLDLMCQQEHFDSHVEVFRLVHTSDTPAEEIIEVARDLKADLIVIAAHAHAKSKRALPGATAAHIVGHAPCPVLLVPACARDLGPDSEEPREVPRLQPAGLRQVK